MAITTRDQLIAAVATGRGASFMKNSTTTAAGFFTSLFRVSGNPAASTGTPVTTGTTFDRTSSGALGIPAPSNTTYANSFEVAASAPGVIFSADRLVEFGGLSGNVTTAQTVSAVSLPTRATGATNVELWLECYTATGATASATVTASYTNSSGTSGRTATLVGGIPASMPVNRMYNFTLAAGDTGVQSVQSLTLGTATGTVGSLGLTLRRTMMQGCIVNANLGFSQGWAETGLAQIADSACVEFYVLAQTTGSGVVMGSIGIAQG